MEGVFFLAGLVAIVWLAYWIAQEGREKPGVTPRWSPFDWRETDATAGVGDEPKPRQAASWRDRITPARRGSAGARRR